ncbi:hypothetical protein FRB99_000408 [Tulasnella sp. 403]|nr:hypothetical protein FRB99_000408 [Tulasnella sp. 403]
MLASFFIFVFLAFHAASASVIDRRQLPNVSVPPACTETCGPYLNMTGACKPGLRSCLCTTEIHDALVTCLQCTVQAGGPDNQIVNVGVAQQAINLYAVGCLKVNVTMSVPTITSYTSFPTLAAADATGSNAPPGSSSSSGALPAQTGSSNAAMSANQALSGAFLMTLTLPFLTLFTVL